MRLNEYQYLAQRTANEQLDEMTRLLVAGLGLAGEAGEVCDLIKKFAGHGHPSNRDAVKDELSDVLWYVAEVAHMYGITLDDIAQHNVDKLRKRYPEGFSTERSLNRSE